MKEEFVITHPLFDAPEEKRSTEGLEPMRMTATVRWSLLSLRVYLVFMMLILVYDVIRLGLHG